MPENTEAAPETQKSVSEENGHAEEQPTEETNGVEKKEDSVKEKEEPVKEMKAVVLLNFGGYKGVKIMKKPEPTPQNGEVLIRVKACGLNFQDLITRLGAIDSPPKTPAIMGFECAGEIEAIGEEVEGFEIGDRVVALPEFKAWAELCCVPAKFVYKLPNEISFNDAAAISMNFVVAYIIVNELLSLKPGKTVLLHSAAGGVGLAIVQLLRTIEGITIFGVCSKSKHEELNDVGIDHLIDRTDYVNEIRKISPEGVDVVLDCMCGEDCNRGYGLLKPMGKYLLYGSANVVTGETKSFFSVARSWWQVDKVSPIKLFDENKSFSGFNLRHLMYQQNGADYVRSAMNDVFKMFIDGKIKPKIDSTWAFEDVCDAMQKMHDRKNIGKLLLDPAQEPKPKPPTPVKAKVKKEKKEKVTSPTKEEAPKAEDGVAEENGKSDESGKAEENGKADEEKPAAENGADKVEEVKVAEEVKAAA